MFEINEKPGQVKFPINVQGVSKNNAVCNIFIALDPAYVLLTTAQLVAGFRSIEVRKINSSDSSLLLSLQGVFVGYANNTLGMKVKKVRKELRALEVSGVNPKRLADANVSVFGV